MQSGATGATAALRINVLNVALKLYFRYRKQIYQVWMIDQDASWPMWEELKDAATTPGWSLHGGVCNLDQAFQHLIKNATTSTETRWTDTNTTSYSGNFSPSVYRATVQDAPEAASNFLSAVNDKLKKLSKISQEHQMAQTRAEAGYDQKIWPTVRDSLESVQSVADKAKPFLWILPEQVTTAEWFKNLSEVLGGFDKAFDGALRADAGAQSFVANRQVGMPPGAAALWAFVGQALSYLPVLGSLYSNVVAQSPGLIANMREIGDMRYRKAGRAAAAAENHAGLGY